MLLLLLLLPLHHLGPHELRRLGRQASVPHSIVFLRERMRQMLISLFHVSDKGSFPLNPILFQCHLLFRRGIHLPSIGL